MVGHHPSSIKSSLECVARRPRVPVARSKIYTCALRSGTQPKFRWKTAAGRMRMPAVNHADSSQFSAGGANGISLNPAISQGTGGKNDAPDIKGPAGGSTALVLRRELEAEGLEGKVVKQNNGRAAWMNVDVSCTTEGLVDDGRGGMRVQGGGRAEGDDRGRWREKGRMVAYQSAGKRRTSAKDLSFVSPSVVGFKSLQWLLVYSARTGDERDSNVTVTSGGFPKMEAATSAVPIRRCSGGKSAGMRLSELAVRPSWRPAKIQRFPAGKSGGPSWKFHLNFGCGPVGGVPVASVGNGYLYPRV
ncbi:hypothetical protein C8F01DRAFT_1091931 [Mycena amicta]|nr:hypothetical protein C8F01DRAFT_1091931 [Mycena amicta]